MDRESNKLSKRKFEKKSKKELKESLSSLQYRVTQEDATEPPFNNEYNSNFDEGSYVDITTGEPDRKSVV